MTNRTGVLTNSASELRKYLQNDTLVALSELPSDWPEVELIFADGCGGFFTHSGSSQMVR